MKLFLKNIGLFFASPFIALGYVIALPFVGLYMFLSLGTEAFLKKILHEEDVSVKHEDVRI